MLKNQFFSFLLKAKKKIFPQIKYCKIKQAKCAKYREVYFDNNITWNKHFKLIEIKLSGASSQRLSQGRGLGATS